MSAPSLYRTLVLLDPQAIRNRRFSIRMSEFDVAEACGVESSVIRRLERGVDQSYLTLGFADDLAKILGCHPTDLFLLPEERLDTPPETGPTEDGTPANDAAQIGALLAGLTEAVGVALLADTLGWPLHRTLRALDHLEESLKAVGQRIAWIADSHVKLTCAVPPEDAIEAIARRQIADAGLTVSSAKALRKIAQNSTGASSATQFGPGIIDALRRAGVISTNPGDDYSRGAPITLSDQAKHDLFLE